jgi:DNA-binding NtrC family response regulator
LAYELLGIRTTENMAWQSDSRDLNKRREHISSILLVASKPDLVNSILSQLSPHYRIESASSGNAVLDLVETGRFDCVLVDMALSGEGTSDLLRQLKQRAGDLPVLMMCTTPDISSAVEAIRAGAADFIIKEVEIAGLAKRIAKLLKRSTTVNKRATASPARGSSFTPGKMVVGKSPAMLEAMQLAQQASAFPVSVLLLGESGTGKELLARWIHRNSDRAEGPFVAVNLAAIPSELIESTLFGHEKGAFTGASGPRSGKFNLAQNGTLLLDEITELRRDLQPKLLRVLQENEFERVGGDRTIHSNARIIAATNRDVSQTVEDGDLRDDLYYRLNVVTVTLPPLRERRDDIPELAHFFLDKYNSSYSCSVSGFDPVAMDFLIENNWPGNIRELENVVQRSVICTVDGTVSSSCLSHIDGAAETRAVKRLADQHGTLEDLERCYIKEVLLRTGGHQGNAAKILGIDRKTLYNKLLKYGLGRSASKQPDQALDRGKIAS